MSDEALRMKDEIQRKSGDPLDPDAYADVFIGWRAWKLCSEGLVSLYKPTHWPPRVALLAECENKVECGHSPHLDSVPGLQCECGIYASRSREQAIDYATRQIAYSLSPAATTYVIGQVSLAGKVIEHSDGWRAELAYPYSLYARGGETADALGRLYGVEAHILEPWPKSCYRSVLSGPPLNALYGSLLSSYISSTPADPPKPKSLIQQVLGK